jgi:hypothetical protein
MENLKMVECEGKNYVVIFANLKMFEENGKKHMIHIGIEQGEQIDLPCPATVIYEVVE